MTNLEELQTIASAIPADIGGGSQLDKINVMAGLADRLGLRTFVEIGVYRGRSFFPLARSFSRRSGFSYGIDPYTRFDAIEKDLPEDVTETVNRFFEEIDYDALFRDVLKRQIEFGLMNSSNFLRQPSQQAVEFFRDRKITADMIHIDGNHDTKFVMQDVNSYVPLLSHGGILVLDDINWDSVKPALVYASERLTLVYSTATYAVLINSRADDRRKCELQAECQRLEAEAQAYLTKSDDTAKKVIRSRSFVQRMIHSARQVLKPNT
jgi:hypothetical protein